MYDTLWKANHTRYEARLSFAKVDAEDTSANTEHLVSPELIAQPDDLCYSYLDFFVDHLGTQIWERNIVQQCARSYPAKTSSQTEHSREKKWNPGSKSFFVEARLGMLANIRKAETNQESSFQNSSTKLGKFLLNIREALL